MGSFIFLIVRTLHIMQVAYHTPPRFPIDVIESIREGAALLFQRLHLRDFARIDGWFLPNSVRMSSSSERKFGRTESGNIIFTDINLVSWEIGYPHQFYYQCRCFIGVPY